MNPASKYSTQLYIYISLHTQKKIKKTHWMFESFYFFSTTLYLIAHV